MDESLKVTLVRVEVTVSRPTEYKPGGGEVLGTQRKIDVYHERGTAIASIGLGRERVDTTELISEAEVRDDDRMWLPGKDVTREDQSIPIKAVLAFQDIECPDVVDHYEFQI